MFPKGSETFILNQVADFRELDVDVVVFGHKPDDDETKHPVWSKYGMSGLTVHWEPATMLRAILRAALLTIRRPGRVPKLLRFLFGSEERRQSGKVLLTYGGQYQSAGPFDAVVAHFGPNGELASELVAAGFVDVPLFTYFHGYDVVKYPSQRQGDPYSLLKKTAGRYLPISAYWRDKLVGEGFDEARTTICRMGVDVNDFRYKAVVREPRSKLKLVSVCRLVEKKGIEYALRGMALVDPSDNDVEYTIVGDGPLRTELEALSAELGISDRVHFVGFKPQPVVGEILASSHVLMAPSVTAQDGDQEGIPVTIMEAMASGLPVVSTRHTGIPELVEDGVTGMLADERDAKGLADAIERIYADPDGYATSAKARERVEALHDSRKNSRQLVQLIAQCR